MNKKITTKLYTWLGALFLVLFTSMGASAQETLHYWNFNNTVDGTLNGAWISSTFPADIGTGEITHTFNPANVVTFAGSTLNAEPAVASGGSFVVQGGTDVENNGAHLDIAVSTVGYENIELTYAARGTSAGFITHNVSYSTDDGLSFTPFATNTGYNVTSFFLTTIDLSSVSALSDNGSVVIRIQLDGATGSTGNNRIDNIKVVGTPKAAEGAVATPLITPGTSSITSNSLELSISVSTEMASIYYTLDGSVPTTSSTLYSAPFEISQATSAEIVTVKAIATAAELTNSDVAEVVYSFPTFVANLGELRANSSGSTVYTITSEVVLTGQDGFRNTKFVQDATGAVQIDDPNPAKITTMYNAGDGITGLTGTLGAFGGQVQFTPTLDPGAATSSGNSITPVERTLATLSADDQSKLVLIKNVEFQTTGTFGGGGSQLDIVDPSVVTPSNSWRNIFGGSNVSGSAIPDVAVHIVGIIQMNSSGIRIGARSLDDITVSPDKFSTNWQYAVESSNLPTWFGASTERGFGVGNGKVYVPSRSAGQRVIVLNAATGADEGTLSVEGVTGGTFGLNDASVSEDGVVFAANLTVDASISPFKVYAWEDGTSDPVVALAFTAAATVRLGDKFNVTGSVADGTAKIWAASATPSVPRVYVWSMVDGDFDATPSVITLSDNLTGGSAAVGPDAHGSFWFSYNGSGVKKYDDTGTLIGVVSTAVVATGSNAISHIGYDDDGNEFVAVFAYGANNENARIISVPNNDPASASLVDATTSMGAVANGNGAGDVHTVVNPDGTYTVFALSTNNGIGSYTWSGADIIFPVTPDYAYVQLIHNSADPALAMVDVYVNSTEVPIFTNVAYRSATVFLGFEAGISHSIILTPAGQPVASGLEFDNLVFMADENYYAVVGGVIDPSQFAVNPSAVSTALIIDIISGALLVNPEGTQEVAFVTYHGSTDAPGVDIAIRDVGVIAVNAMYTDVVDYVSAPADAYIIDIAPTAGDVLFSYSADFSNLGGQTAMVIASGFLTPSANKDGEDFALIAVLVDGTVVNLPLTSTDIESGIGLPDDFRLSQNYPNPFNPTTRIEFDMPVSGDVTLAVYDLLGRQVALLANENYAAGTHNIAFDASQLASSVYVYRLNVAGQTFTRKMTLVK